MGRSLQSIHDLRGVGMSPAAIPKLVEAVQARLGDPAGSPTAQKLTGILTQDEAIPPRQAKIIAGALMDC